MTKKSPRITAPRLWLVIAKSYHALSLPAEQSIANMGLCLTDFAALEALLLQRCAHHLANSGEGAARQRFDDGRRTARRQREEVIEKVVRYSEALGGISSLSFQMNVASLPHVKLTQAIEAVGTRVAPAVRERLAAKSKLSETWRSITVLHRTGPMPPDDWVGASGRSGIAMFD
jgi:hypothetical protein